MAWHKNCVKKTKNTKLILFYLSDDTTDVRLEVEDESWSNVGAVPLSNEDYNSLRGFGETTFELDGNVDARLGRYRQNVPFRNAEISRILSGEEGTVD